MHAPYNHQVMTNYIANKCYNEEGLETSLAAYNLSVLCSSSIAILFFPGTNVEARTEAHR